MDKQDKTNKDENTNLDEEKNTVLEIQQRFCNSFGYSDQIVWDSYYINEKSTVSNKIKSIFGVTELKQDADAELTYNDDLVRLDADISKNKDNIRLKERVDLIIEKVWNQKKYNGNVLLMVPIFIICVDSAELKNSSLKECCASTNYSIHPVFRIRKCIKNDDSTGCCMIFVDENARVYQNWNEFKNNNLLPKSYVVAPHNGIYNIDADHKVILEMFLPPSGKTLGKIKNAVSAIATVGQIGAGVVMIGTLPFTAPVAATAATCAGIVGLTCSAVTTGQSVNALHDMKKHEKSIGIENPEARSAIVSIAGGLTAFAAGAATKLIGYAASTGSTIGTTGRAAVNIINGATIVVNGVGVGNGFFEFMIKIKSDEKVSMLEVAQLASSLFLLTHSVVNFQSASKIITNYQNKTIYDLRADLSRNNKKMFDKMYKETTRISGIDASKKDLIRTLRNIPDKHQFFRDLNKVNKNLNQNNVRISYKGETGMAYLNHEIAVRPSDLRQNLKTNTATQVFSGVPEIPISNASSNIVISNTSSSLKVQATITTLVGICSSLDINDLTNSIINIAETLTRDACDLFFDFVEEFVSTEKKSIENELHRFVPMEQYVNDIFKVLLNLSGEFISDFIKNNITNRKFMYHLIHEFYDNLRPQGELSGHCKICGGKYYVC